ASSSRADGCLTGRRGGRDCRRYPILARSISAEARGPCGGGQVWPGGGWAGVTARYCGCGSRTAGSEPRAVSLPRSSVAVRVGCFHIRTLPYHGCNYPMMAWARSDPLYRNIRVIEGCGIGGHVTWVASEYLGGCMQCGRHYYERVDGIGLFPTRQDRLTEHGADSFIGIQRKCRGAGYAARAGDARTSDGRRRAAYLRDRAVLEVLAEGIDRFRVRPPGLG